jgi:hypothetical protein
MDRILNVPEGICKKGQELTALFDFSQIPDSEAKQFTCSVLRILQIFLSSKTVLAYLSEIYHIKRKK